MKAFQYIKAYWYMVMAAFSRLLNAFAGNDPRETLSSHIGKKIRDGKSFTLGEKIYYAIVNPIVGSAHWVSSIDDTVGGDNAWKRQGGDFI